MKNIYTGATQAIGEDWARSLVRRGRRSRAMRAARQGFAAGSGPTSWLAAAAPSSAAQAVIDSQRALVSHIAPTPGCAALIKALSDSTSPVVGTRAVVLGIGPGTARELELLLRSAGRQSVHETVFAVDPSVQRPLNDRVLTPTTDLWTGVAAGMRWAQETIDADHADVLAVIVRTPVTGIWSQDLTVDVGQLISSLLARRDHPVWIALNQPADPSAWPDEVVLTLPMSARGFVKGLRRAGLLQGVTPRRVGRNALNLRSSEAAALLVALSDPLSRPPSGIGVPVARRIGAQITLTLRDAANAGHAQVEVDDGIGRHLQEFVSAAGVKFTAQAPHGSDLLPPMSVFPSLLIAWRAAEQMSSPSSAGHVISEGTVPFRWLSEACDSADGSVAAAILADHGRAWIESSDLHSVMPLIKRVASTFPRNSRAHLWAHFLIALDAALRSGRPDAAWFDEEYCAFADRTELGLLYRTEAMEFSRLRGDMATACSQLNQLSGRLTADSKSLNSAQSYADSTARYVSANTLRGGGRYDRARELIIAAASGYDSSIPSHHIELTHAVYALAVCDSMRGLATVRATDWDEGQAVFAKSLVTLANSHASWFVEDYQRAVEFARLAREGFTSIGYQRYAKRSDDLARLIAEWARRAGRVIMGEEEADERVRALLAVPVGGATELLASERPSRALSLLKFAVTFGRDPDGARSVALPPYIAIEADGRYVLRNLPPASSFRQADQLLRSVLGIGADVNLPLAAD